MSDKQRRQPAPVQVRDDGPGLAAPDAGAGRQGRAGVGNQALAARLLDDPGRLPAVLAAAQQVPAQDVIYEQLARLGAYGGLDDARLAAWGYRRGAVLDRPGTGLHAAVFLPLPGAAAPTTPTGHAMLELHGAPLRPVLAFRGAARGKAPPDDFDAQGIGSFQFAANEADIVSSLRGARSRVDVIGHGLGGTLAQLAASRFPQAIGRVVTYQAPPVDEQDAAMLDAWNGRVAAHQRVASTHHRVGAEVEPGPGERRTPGRAWNYSLADDVDPAEAMPLAQLSAARGDPLPGILGLDGQPQADRLLSVRSAPVGEVGPPLGEQRLRDAVAGGLERRSAASRSQGGQAQVEALRRQVLDMASSTSFGFRQIVAFVQGQQGLSAPQKVALQEEARQRYRQGR